LRQRFFDKSKVADSKQVILMNFKFCLILTVAISAVILLTSQELTARQESKTDMKTLPAANAIRAPGVDIKHIVLDLRFDWKKKQAFGTATITLSPTKSTRQITLDAAKLSIDSIVLPSGNSLSFDYDGNQNNDSLKIGLDRVYEAKEDLTLKIKYRTNHVNNADPNNIWGSLGKGIRFQGPTSTTPIKRRQIWSAGEPESNRFWFPGYDAPNDLRTTEFIATVEKPLTVVANGELIGVKDNQDGTRTFHFKSATPYPNYLTSFAIGEFIPVKQKSGDIEIVTYGYPDETKAVEASVEQLPNMIQFFSEKTGAAFPFPQYTQVVVQDYPFPGPVGQHTAAIMSDNMIDDARTHNDFFYLWDAVEAQSLANQWFGNLITPKTWEHVWLSQAFSRYMDGQFTINANGHDEFLTYNLNYDLSLVLGDWNSGYRHPIVTAHFDDVRTFSSDNYGKFRGALVLRMLHEQLGDEKWWKAVRHYVATNANRQVTTADFQNAIKEATGESLDWFFDQWVHKMGHPVFIITKSYDASKQELTLTVKQIQEIDATDSYPQVEFFQGKIDVEIDDKVEQVTLKPLAENVFSFQVSDRPKLVNFDHNSVWIKEIEFAKPLEELLYQVRHDRDVLGQRFAMGELTKLAKDQNASPELENIIVSTLRDVTLSDAYWRLRIGSLSQLQSLLTPASHKGSIALDDETIDMLRKLVHDDAAWMRRSAISYLGTTHDEKHAEIYLEALNDESDRVINAAATALGQSKSPLAFDALVKLKDKPSWKSQSLISTLNGLRELGDPRGFDVAMNALSDKTLPRWWLASPTWDYPIAAIETIVVLNKRESAFPILLERFEGSLADDDYNDIFANVLLIAELGDTRGKQVFTSLKSKFQDDENAMEAVKQFEQRFEKAIQLQLSASEESK